MQKPIFNKTDNGLWEATFPLEGAVTIHVQTAQCCKVYVYAALGSIPPAFIGCYGRDYSTSTLFTLKLPKGAIITLRADAEPVDVAISAIAASPADSDQLNIASSEEVRHAIQTTINPE